MSIKTRFQDSNNWILNKPESLTILMLMGTGIGSLFFASFSVAMGFSRNWFLMALFGLFCYGALKQFINTVKMVKISGIKGAFGGITAREFVWRKDKYGNKIGGNEDGRHSGTEQDIDKGSQYNEEGNGEDRGQVRGSEEDTKPADPWDSLSVRIDEDNRKEAGNYRGRNPKTKNINGS